MKVTIDTKQGPVQVRAYENKAGLAITKLLIGGTQTAPRFGKPYVVTHLPTGKTISFNAAYSGFGSLEEAKRFFDDMTALGDWSKWKTADDVPAAVREACCHWS